MSLDMTKIKEERAKPIPEKLTFFSICKMLWDWKGWRYTGVMDEVEYRDTRLVFYLAECCITLRRAPRGDAVYQVFIPGWFVFNLICWRLMLKIPKTVEPRQRAAAITAYSPRPHSKEAGWVAFDEVRQRVAKRLHILSNPPPMSPPEHIAEGEARRLMTDELKWTLQQFDNEARWYGHTVDETK